MVITLDFDAQDSSNGGSNPPRTWFLGSRLFFVPTFVDIIKTRLRQPKAKTLADRREHSKRSLMNKRAIEGMESILQD